MKGNACHPPKAKRQGENKQLEIEKKLQKEKSRGHTHLLADNETKLKGESLHLPIMGTVSVEACPVGVVVGVASAWLVGRERLAI